MNEIVKQKQMDPKEVATNIIAWGGGACVGCVVDSALDCLTPAAAYCTPTKRIGLKIGKWIISGMVTCYTEKYIENKITEMVKQYIEFEEQMKQMVDQNKREAINGRS